MAKSTKEAFVFRLNIDEKERDDGSSTEWTVLIDRGGLIHVTHDSFFSMEMEVRKY